MNQKTFFSDDHIQKYLDKDNPTEDDWYEIGRMYLHNGDKKRAKKYLLKAAKKNSTKAMISLSIMTKDTYWMEQAAKLGNKQALTKVGLMNLDNTKLAYAYFSKAAERNEPEAEYMIAMRYYAKKEFKKCLEYLSRSSQHGYVQATRKLDFFRSQLIK